MKLTLCNNSELVIKALNETDYKKALLVAEMMTNDSMLDCDIGSVCDDEFIVHMCAVSDLKQASDFKFLYTEAKKSLK